MQTKHLWSLLAHQPQFGESKADIRERAQLPSTKSAQVQEIIKTCSWSKQY
jgi:hypothetical protein